MRLSIILCAFALTTATWAQDAAPGTLEGRLKIVSLKGVELAKDNSSGGSAIDYNDYPLAVKSGEKEVAHFNADGNGNYHLSLAPGDYVLDIQDRAHKHLRGEAKSFTLRSNQTTRVDIEIDTGVR